MGTYKTPGVYIVEKNAFPNSVVEVETAVPAFVGYTEIAMDGTHSLLKKAFKINSFNEFEIYFGGANKPIFTFSKKEIENQEVKKENTGEEPITGYPLIVNKTEYVLQKPKNLFTLYNNIRLYFANGGGPCYIVSIGNYLSEIKKDDFIDGIEVLKEEQEPTMVVIPEAINNEFDGPIQQLMLDHCAKMQSRIAILDVADDPSQNTKSISDTFRDKVKSNLSYGAAYFPYLQTSVLTEKDVTYKNLDADSLALCMKDANGSDIPPKNETQSETDFHNLLYQNSPLYKEVVTEIRNILNLLPPSAAMAGIFTMVDNERGVWKAPANVPVNQVVSLSRILTNTEQEDLNVTMNGKSINAIRYFTGEGIKVWGARTLDGNSLDWRYINVRRTMIFLEQSIKNAARAYVFEPNVAATWLTMKCMIENFLRGVWKRGGLAGTTPEDAFEVHVGLGDTMTAEDILDGYLRITILVAISHPAEFIEITFQQQMQKS